MPEDVVCAGYFTAKAQPCVVVVAPIPKLRDRYIRRRVHQLAEFRSISDVDVEERKRRKRKERQGV